MNKYPLIKFTILFICGIFLQSVFHFNAYALFIVLVPLFIISTITFYFNFHSLSSYADLSLVISVILTGSLYYFASQSKSIGYPFREEKIKGIQITGKIYAADLIRNGILIYYLKSDSIKTAKNKPLAGINLMVRIKDSQKRLDSLYDQIQIGNKIELRGTLLKPRNERNPGEFDYEKYLGGKGISGLLNVNNTKNVKIISREISFMPNTIFRIRKSMDRSIESLHNQSTAALLRGLLLADRSLIDNKLKDEFVNAGVIHVLAVSGLHVGFIILIFVFLFKRINIYTRYVFTIIGLLCFLIITGMPASVTRATIMACALISAPLTGRSYNSINSLALSALVILLFDPGQLFEPGFQLSYAAVVSILVIYPPILNYVNKIKLKSVTIRYLILFCGLSFAAQIGTLPFILLYFHRISLVTFLANLFVIPLIGFIVGLGIFTISIGTLSAAIGGIFASTNELLCYLLFRTVGALGNPDFSFIRIINFSFYDSVIFYLLLGVTIYKWKDLTSRSVRIAVVIFAVMNFFVWIRVDNRDLLYPNKLSVMMIDVGQGDSFLIKFPNRKSALIDAGNATKYFDNGEKVISPLLDRLNIDKINYAFISHVDSDHYKGFLYLIKTGRIELVYKPKINPPEEKDVSLEKLLCKYKIPVKYYSKDILKIGNARLYILNDTTRNSFLNFSTNDQSGMLKLVLGTTSFLFTGDVGKKSEKFYIDHYGKFLKSDILKAGHHGSKYSTSEMFLNFVQPSKTLISVGYGNIYGHPGKEVIDNFIRGRIRIYRTDKSGAVLFCSDGDSIRNINWKKHESRFIF